MNTLWVRTFAAFTLLVLAACSGSAPKGTQVTRFHLDETIPPQPVSLKTEANDSIEFNAYYDLVVAELAQLGFPVTTDETELLIDIAVTRGTQIKPPERSPMSIGIGGGSFGGNVGIGGGASFPVGGSDREVYVTKLEVKFVRKSENAIKWEGRASRETKTAPKDPTETMQKLVSALFSDFPGESGKTIVIEDTP